MNRIRHSGSKRVFFVLIFLALLFSALGSANSSVASARPAEPPTAGAVSAQQAATPQGQGTISRPIASQFIIQFRGGASEAAKKGYVHAQGGNIVQRIDALNILVIQLPANSQARPSSNSPIVRRIERDQTIDALDDVIPPNDPRYAEQWALPAIGAAQAWAQMPADAPVVTVAVIDSGVCADHPDLQGRILDGWDFLQNDAVPQDEFGHGCSVTGVIAANSNNGIGIAGVAPNAQVMPLRVLDANGSGSYSNVAAAIVYAADHGAQVINLSLGGSSPSATLQNAVNYAVSRNVIVVAAAGNSGSEGVLYPAAYPEVIAVGSVDPDLQHSSFSNYGAQIDIWAPGRDILTTKRDGSYGLVSGTSFAAPYVAGAEAILTQLGGTLGETGGILALDTANSMTPIAPTETPTPAAEIPTPIIGSKTPSPSSEHYELVSALTFSRGSGAGEVGISALAPERLPVGPSSISLDQNNNIYLLDPINAGVLKIDAAHGEVINTINYSEDIFGIDIGINSAGDLYLADGRSDELFLYSQAGRLLDSLPVDLEQLSGVDIRSADEAYIYGLSTRVGGENLSMLHDSVQLVPQSGALAAGTEATTNDGIFAGNISLNLSGAVAFLKGPDFTRSLSISVTEEIAGVPWFDIDSLGNIYLLVETFAPDAGNISRVNGTILKYDPAGDLITSFPIPNTYYAVPANRVSLSSDGSIYQLLVGDTAVYILKWSSSSLASGNPLDPSPYFFSPSAFDLQSANTINDSEGLSSQGDVEALGITRTQVINNAEAYRSYNWTPSSSNCGSRTCPDANTGAACPVSQNKFPAGSPVTGVAYQWGGYDTISSFASKLSQGYLSGDVSGTSCVASCATGVDCSGFVSRAWNVGRYTTRTISQISTALASGNDVKAGDIFNLSSSHVVLFSYFDGAHNPYFYESSWAAGKVRLWSGWTYIDGYEPRRFNEITDEGGGNTQAQCDVIRDRNGISLFDSTECNGSSKTYTSPTILNLTDVGFNDVTRSIQLGPGWSVMVWQDINRTGASRCMKRADTAGSMAFWDLYKNSYSGSSLRIWNGNGAGTNITSIRVFNNEDCYEAPAGPGKPSLESPGNGSNIPNPDAVNFNWSDTGDSYTFVLSGGPSAGSREVNSSDTYFNSLWAGAYQWYVVAHRNGQNNQSDTWSLNVRPGIPSYVNVSTNSTSAVTVNWGDSAGGVDGYRIYRNGSQVQQVAGGQHSYQVTGLPCGDTSSYSVRGYKGGLESDSRSASGSTTQCLPGPNTPSLLSPDNNASIPNPQSVNLDWSDSGDSYTINLTGNGANAPWQGDSSSSQISLGSLWPGVYQWRVTAFRNGQSAVSGWRTLNVPPGAPGSVGVTTNSTSQVTVHWTASPGGASEYRIYRNGSLINTVTGDVYSYQVSGLSCGNSSNYSVKGYKNGLESAAGSANGSTVQCPTVPTVPVLISPANGASIPNPQSITFDWSESGTDYEFELTGGLSEGTTAVTPDMLDFGSMWPGIYQWRVRAHRGTTWSAWSSARTLNITPGAPGNLGLVTDSYEAISLNWEASPGGVDGYNIYIDDVWVDSVAWDIDPLGYQATGLGCEQEFTFSVTGYAGSLESPPATITGSTDPCPLTVHVLDLFTTDGDGAFASLSLEPSALAADAFAKTYKSDFLAGDAIQFWMEVENRYPDAQTAYFEWLVYDPAGRHVPALEWTGELETVSGTIYWLLPRTLSEELLTGEYLFEGAVTFNGERTVQYYWFNVDGLETVELTDVWSFQSGPSGLEAQSDPEHPGAIHSQGGQEARANETPVYNVGDEVVLVIGYYNNVVEEEYAAFEWYVTDPLGRYVDALSYSGDFYTHLGPDMWWGIIKTIPANAVTGTYTVDGYITHNGRTTWDSAEFYVNGVSGPANDEIGTPEAISAVAYSTSADTWPATVAVDDPSPSCGSGTNSNSVWYTYTPPADGLLQVDTWGSNYDTVLAIWSGAPGSLTEVACNDDFEGYLEAWLDDVPVTGGTTYYIEAMDYGDPGGGDLQLYADFAAAPPHDDFDSPVSFGPMPYSQSIDIRGATQAVDDPELTSCNRLPGAQSVWYTYTPAADGELELNTSGSNFDTMLAVWTGTRGSLVSVGCNDDYGYVNGAWDSDSILWVPVTAGTPYTIEVSTYAGMIDANGASARELLQKPGTALDETASPLGAANHKSLIEANQAHMTAQQGSRAGDVSAEFWRGSLELHADFFASAPLAPTGLAATTGSYTDKVQVSWSPAAHAGRYELWRNTDKSVAAATLVEDQIPPVGSPVLFGDTTVTPGTVYFYWLKACNTIGCSDLTGPVVGYASSGTRINIIRNGGLEQGSDSPESWTSGQMEGGASIFEWDSLQRHTGLRSMKISSGDFNEAYWSQTIPIQQNAGYRLAGWVKTENVSACPGCTEGGASLSLAGTTERSEYVTGTQAWTYVELYFNSGDKTEVTLLASLGGAAAQTAGMAWFDDLKFELLSPPVCYDLTTNVTPALSGSIALDPAPNCGEAQYAHGTQVKLTGTPATGYSFGSWGGDLTGSTNIEHLVMTAPRSVSAAFTLNTYLLSVSKTGAGVGTITSSPAGINCGADCSETYNHNTTVTLTASPVIGSFFAGWSGACTGTAACSVSMTAPKSVTANFVLATKKTQPFKSVGKYDGWILESTETSQKGSLIDTLATSITLGDDALDRQYRSILSFNTAGLPDNAQVFRVTLKIKQKAVVGTNPIRTHGPLLVDVRKPYFGTGLGLAAGDFASAAGLPSAGTFGKIPGSSWYSAVLGESANAVINLTGPTQFRLRFTKDDNDDRGADYLQFWSGNALTGNRPMLIIEYFIP